MVASRVATFLDDLRASQLLDVRQVDEVARAVKLPGDDPTSLAREFVQRKLLTPFQVNHLIRGTSRELILGPYRLLDRVGGGGMGQVFKASHQMLNRVVALKVMRKDKLSNPSAVRRFNQEIRAAAQLVHPNIVMAFDAGQADDTHYFAMEYVEGTDLLKLVKGSGPLPVALACDCIRQVALGLQHAHGCSLIHRDIKPSNLLLTQSQGSQSVAAGQVKILDMGLARLQSDDGAANGLTKLGTVVGTMEYVAPEQARNSSTVD